MPIRSIFRCLTLLLALFTCLAGVFAQTLPAAVPYPSKEIQLIVPFEPGGGMDGLARQLARQLSLRLEQQVLVINHSGADGNIGTIIAARGKPDGHTLLFTGVSHITSPMLHTAAGYDPIRDFDPIAKIAVAPNVLLVNAALKDKTLTQLLQARDNDGHQLAFGSGGVGSTSHLAAEIFKSRTGAKWLHVPYRGSGPALRALMAGEVQVMFVPASSVASALVTNRTHALAVAHPTRLPQYPELPTLAEIGVKDAEFTQWYGLFAPAGTPATVLDALAAATQAAVQTNPLAMYLTKQGMQPAPLQRQAFARHLAEESKRLSSLLKREDMVGPTR